MSSSTFRRTAAALALSHLLFVGGLPVAQAQMIGSQEIIQHQQQQLDRQQLLQMLDAEGVHDKLVEMGVPRDQVEARINSLTSAELARFNQQLNEAPAGAGAVGIIVLFLVIFIVTDMLCATNIFSFVKCINR